VKSDNVTGVSLSITVFPCQYESNNAQYSFSKLFLTRDKPVNPGDLPTKVNALPAMDGLQEREQSYCSSLHILAATDTADVDVTWVYVLLNDVARQFHD
jgi:hypothetical protein